MGAEITLDYQKRSITTREPDDDDSLAAGIVEEAPLSSGQKSMWFLQQFSPDNIAYNVYRAVEVQQHLDLKVFEEAWQAMILRHASLRTTFIVKNGEPLQRVHENLNFSLAVHDAHALDDQQLDEVLCRDALRPFNLEKGPLFRIAAYQRSKNHFVLLFNFHHIVTDLWSFTIIMGDLGAYYDALSQGRLPKLLSIRTSYIDYVKEQHMMLSGAKGKELWSFWQNSLAGELPVLQLKADRRRPVLQTFVGKAESLRLDNNLATALNDLAKRMNSSLPVVLLAAFKVLLYRYTGQEDIIVGTPKACRSRKTLTTVGFFVNTIPIRSRLNAHQRFVDLLRQVDNNFTIAGEQHVYPFSLMVEKIQPKRDPGRSPVYQAVFSFQKSSKKIETDGLAHIAVGESGGQMSWGSIAVTTKAVSLCVAPFDLSLLAAETDSDIILSLQYNLDLFEQKTITRMLVHFAALLHSIVENPYEFLRHLPILDQKERSRVLHEWNSTFRENVRRHSVKDHFEHIAASLPDAVAILQSDRELTYRRLNEKANQVAHFIRKKNVNLETPVAIKMDRSLQLFIGIWGILKAGGAYLPLDPSYPKERIDFMLKDSGVKVVLTQESYLSSFSNLGVQVLALDLLASELERESVQNPDVTVYPDSLAYIIYTSGSTGKPKGTLLQNRGIGNLVEVQRRVFDIQKTDRILQYASISFDASVWEMVMAHLNGAALVLTPADAQVDPRALVEFLRERAVSVVTLPPSLVAMLPKMELPRLRAIITAGEACRLQSVQLWSHGHRFYNAYGPTETTVCATIKDVTGSTDPNPPIGRPLDNFRLYVLDGDLQPVPIGVPGELFISGISLARGYVNRPDLTATHFLPDPYNPHSGARMYKTGDRVCFLSSGDIEFLGRIDLQVKMRGYRIETGEIQNALLEHPEVHDAVVIARSDGNHDMSLCAYYKSTTSEPLNRAELASFLRKTLPAYMIPAFFMHMKEFPLTQNGKIDSSSFPVPSHAQQPGRPLVKPQNELERIIAAVWRETLGVENPSIHDNFFEIGGHSILMMKLHASLLERFDANMSVVELFQYPTIASQAQLILRSKDQTMTTLRGEKRATLQKARLAAQRQQMRNRRIQSARDNSN